MFAASMAAAAVVSDDVDTVLAAGLSVIPPGSRLANAVRLAIDIAGHEPTFEEALDQLHAALRDLHWVHVINNAALVALALKIGRDELSRGICMVVMGGWDTDSNGATVGGVLGAMTGAARLPDRWIDPLRNRIATSLRGFDGIGFDELARRTLALVAS
jgi:ADP-ribosylglycohydrolase